MVQSHNFCKQLLNGSGKKLCVCLPVNRGERDKANMFQRYQLINNGQGYTGVDFTSLASFLNVGLFLKKKLRKK